MDTIGMVPPAGIAELHMDPREPMPYVGEGQLLGKLDEAGIDAFVAAAGPGSGSALVSAEIRHLGGALARPQAGQGSLGTLDCQFMTFGVGALAFEGAGTASTSTSPRPARTRPGSTGPTSSIGCAPSRRRTTRTTCFAPTTRSRSPRLEHVASGRRSCGGRRSGCTHLPAGRYCCR
jgi:hypothetical protein